MLDLANWWDDFCDFFVEGELICARRRDNGHRFAAQDAPGLRELLEEHFGANPFRGEIVRYGQGGWISGPCL